MSSRDEPPAFNVVPRGSVRAELVRTQTSWRNPRRVVLVTAFVHALVKARVAHRVHTSTERLSRTSQVTCSYIAAMPVVAPRAATTVTAAGSAVKCIPGPQWQASPVPSPRRISAGRSAGQVGVATINGGHSNVI
eukprot:363920-Chlamydomonas_euryale.AAC.14